MRRKPRYTALAERLYGGGWRITIKNLGYDVAFYRRTDWPKKFPCGQALDELHQRGWDIDPVDRHGKRMRTFGWACARRVHEFWTASLIRRDDPQEPWAH